MVAAADSKKAVVGEAENVDIGGKDVAGEACERAVVVVVAAAAAVVVVVVVVAGVGAVGMLETKTQVVR